MPIQYPNFQADPGLKPDFSGITNLPQNIAQGYKLAMMPYQMQQEKKKQEF